MATRTTRRPPARPEPQVEMSMFGRRWRPTDWLIPAYAWSLIIVVGAVVNQLQKTGTIDPGASSFVAGCVGVTAMAMLCGLSLGGTAVMTRRVTLWCVGLPMAGGAWVCYATQAGLTSGSGPWLVCMILAALTAATYRNVRDFQRDHELRLIYAQEDEAEEELAHAYQLAEQLAQAQSPEPDADAVQWETFMEDAGLAGMIFHGRYALRNGGGIMLHFELPDSGAVSYEMAEQASGKMEIQLFKKFRHLFEDGSVRPGCVQVRRATDKQKRPLVGEIFVYIDVRDILAQTLRLPTTAEDYTELSITEAFQVGEFSDGSPIYLTVHEIHILIIGQTQNGKSNLLHVIIRQLARCTDAVMWGLDFKGGDTLRLWMNAYMRGEIDPHTGQPLARCIFDWVAVNDHIEAERMLLSALEAATKRPGIVGGGGWVPSKQRPAIVVIADEISEIVGMTGGRGGRSMFHVGTDVLAQLLSRMFKLGTGQGVYGITASQRGTVDSTGGGTAKSQQKGRILLPVTEGASDVLQGSGPEATRLAKSLVHKGSAVFEGFGHTIPKAGKIWLAGHKAEIHERIRHEVLQLTHLRRDVRLDSETEQFILKFGYAGRPGGPTPDPDRIAWYFGKDPIRQPLTWDYEYVAGSTDPVKVAAAAGHTGGTPMSTAQMLGLEDPAPDRPAAAAATAAGATVTPITAKSATGAARKAWEQRYADRLAEPVPDDPAVPPIPGLENPAPPPADPEPEPEPARPVTAQDLVPRGQKPTYDNSVPLMIHLVHAAGTAGTSGASVWHEMGRLDHAPNRATMYQWLTRLCKDTARNADRTKKVIQSGQMFMTEANKPDVQQLAS